jgi:hypothetical protein
MFRRAKGPFLCKIMFLECKMIHFLKYVSGESPEETNQTNAHWKKERKNSTSHY